MTPYKACLGAVVDLFLRSAARGLLRQGPAKALAVPMLASVDHQLP
jgi:hypothetical protein